MALVKEGAALGFAKSSKAEQKQSQRRGQPLPSCVPILAGFQLSESPHSLGSSQLPAHRAGSQQWSHHPAPRTQICSCLTQDWVHPDRAGDGRVGGRNASTKPFLDWICNLLCNPSLKHPCFSTVWIWTLIILRSWWRSWWKSMEDFTSNITSS